MKGSENIGSITETIPQSQMLFSISKTSVIIDTFQLWVFMGAFHQEISSFFNKNFIFISCCCVN